MSARRSEGRANVQPSRTTRRYRDIVKANVATRFTAIIAVLALVVLLVGDPLDAIFAFVLAFNITVGMVQEIRAKRSLDRLQVLTTPTVRVRRAGIERDIAPAEVVLDDVVLLGAGDQVPVDARVSQADGLEVDESSLTGESDPVPKLAGDEVLSGSAVVAGTAVVVAVRVGEQASVHRLVAQARQFVLTRSELREGIDRILQAISWMLPAVAALLLWSQLRADRSVADGLVSAVAGVVGLVPQGLVLLVSLAMAVAIGRLARDHVVVQELAAVEGLARVDVLCVDKTGTLTTGELAVESIEALEAWPARESAREPAAQPAPVAAPVAAPDELALGLAALVGTESNPNATLAILSRHLPTAPSWPVSGRVAFSSARKWSATSFGDRGTWLIGAPEVLLDAVGTNASPTVRKRVSALAAEAKRVLLVGWSPHPLGTGTELPAAVHPVGLVVLSEQARGDAATTMAYFARQHVTVKVISGDNPRTVSAVAVGLGVPGAEAYVDLREVQGPLAELAERTTVFGRVLPEQKRELVEALQQAGHVVAMTGDGVNDIPALKRADIGIAMDTATPATKAVAQLVLLDGRFDHLPRVVAEGRRVIANMERVSALFLTKTVYATVFALVVGLSGAVFPFLPRHLSLVSELTVGIPAFVLSFRSIERPVEAGYLGRVLRFAVPAGLGAASVTLLTYWLSRPGWFDSGLGPARSASTFALGVMSLWILYRLVRPLDRFEAVLIGTLLAVLVLAYVLPVTRSLYALELPSPAYGLATGLVVVGGIVLLQVVFGLGDRLVRRRRTS